MNEIQIRRRTPLERSQYFADKITELQDQIIILSEMRREALREMAETMKYREIAAELGISEPRVSQLIGRGWRRPRKAA